MNIFQMNPNGPKDDEEVNFKRHVFITNRLCPKKKKNKRSFPVQHVKRQFFQN